MNKFKSITAHIPNVITSFNIICGCLSIVFAFNDKIILASLLIFAAGLFDFADGFAARLLKAYSEVGKSLDSLADVISFGVAPSVIMFQLLVSSVSKNNPVFSIATANVPDTLIIFSAFVITVFSALRLAKFNVDTRQTSSFIGVPTPANAFLIASLPFLIKDYPGISNWALNYYILLPLIALLSYLLVSEIPMISLKFKNIGIKENKSKYILLISSLILLICLKFSAIPVIFVLYIILSVVDNPQELISSEK